MFCKRLRRPIPSVLVVLQDWTLSNVLHMPQRMWHQSFCSTLDWPGTCCLLAEAFSAAFELCKHNSPCIYVLQQCLCLCSGDAGVGLNVRRLTKQFTSTFTTSYSLRPVGDVGSVYRRYPGQWQVFVEDPSMEPGRYLLAAERPSRPAGLPCIIFILVCVHKRLHRPQHTIASLLCVKHIDVGALNECAAREQ